MNVSNTSAMSLLMSLLSSQNSSSTNTNPGNNVQGADSDAAGNAGRPPSPPIGSGGVASQFAGGALSALLSTQNSTSTLGVSSLATSAASQLISAFGSNGELSLSQLQGALSGTGAAAATSSVAATSLSGVFSALDTNGDGELSVSELASGLQNALGSAGGPHRGAHHGHPPATSDTASTSTVGVSSLATSAASRLISALGSNGELSLSQIDSALSAAGGGATSSVAATSLSSLFSSLDVNGNGELSVSELASGLQKAINAAGGPPPGNAVSSVAGSASSNATVSSASASDTQTQLTALLQALVSQLATSQYAAANQLLNPASTGSTATTLG
jgi:Ca2+-binding EF-hand superfamily protein